MTTTTTATGGSDMNQPNQPTHGVRVTIAKPHAASTATFHVHAAGCRDLKASKYCMVDAFTIEAATRTEVVLDTYPPDNFDYDPATELAAYEEDFDFYPCCAAALDRRVAEGDPMVATVRITIDVVLPLPAGTHVPTEALDLLPASLRGKATVDVLNVEVAS